MKRNAAETYKTQAIMTAPPAKLVAMCYDRAIGSLMDAITAIEKNDIQRRCDNATRAANIIAHLWSTLDMEKGGEIAQNLSSIYGFAMQRLLEINMRNDAKVAQEVIDLLKPLAQSWNALANMGEDALAASAARPPMPTPALPRASRTPPRPHTPPQAPSSGRPSGGIAISV